MKFLYDSGLKMSEIARLLNVSRQYIHQQITDYKSFSDSGLTYAKFPRLSIGKCEKCKTRAKAAHHIDGDSRNNDIKNLMPLCRICHILIH